MIYIVHGENTVKSRALIINQQKKLGVSHKLELDISDTTPVDLFNAVHSVSLFGEAPFVLFNISQAGRSNLEEYSKSLKNAPESAVVIIFSEKPLSAANLFIKNAAGLNAKVINNSNEDNISVFAFLDTLFSKSRKKTYTELNQLLQVETEPMYLFNMIVYQLRSLALFKFAAPSADKKAPFVKAKMARLTKTFSQADIFKLYSQLYDLNKQAVIGEISMEMLVPLAVENVLNSR